MDWFRNSWTRDRNQREWLSNQHVGDKMTNLILIILFVSLIACVVLLFQYAGRYVYNYEIKETGVEIVLFGKIPLKRMDFNNIVEIRKTTYKETMPFKNAEMFSTLRFGNRIWGDIVLVRLKKGFVKAVLITPDNADRFINDVQQRLPK